MERGRTLREGLLVLASVARSAGGRPGTGSEGGDGVVAGEGVEAEGTRTRTVIPAGEIGNEREIEIVSERWYSPELQVVVSSRHSDPRLGETSYRLQNLSRGEPDKALFEVPAGFKVSDTPPHKRMKRERKEESPDPGPRVPSRGARCSGEQGDHRAEVGPCGQPPAARGIDAPARRE